jgi:hypothetical protein
MIADLRDRLRLLHSLSIAMEVQRRLLPASAPKVRGLDVAGPRGTANRARSSETRSRGKAAISVARLAGIRDSPRREASRCPAPPTTLSLGSLGIARPFPADSRRPLQTQELSQNVGLAAGIALRCRAGLGSLAQRSGTANAAESHDGRCVPSRRSCHERCVLPRHP